jgi:hypothetical protein
VASFVYNTAMRDSMLPRKPLPASTPARGPEQKRAENPTQTILPATPASASGAAAGAASGGENQK